MRGQFVLPLERFEQVVQDLRQGAGLFAGTNQADHHLVEGLRVLGHRL